MARRPKEKVFLGQEPESKIKETIDTKSSFGSIDDLLGIPAIAKSSEVKRTLNDLVNALKKTPYQEEVSNYNDNDRFVQTKKVIDSKNTRVSRTKVTETVCDECGFDLSIEIGRNYESLSDKEKLIVPQILEGHKKEHHPVSTKLIITGKQLKDLHLGIVN